MYQFYSRICKCELISETGKALIALNYWYSLITLNGSPSKISLKGEYNVCYWFKATMTWSLESLVINNLTLLKLSGPDGIQAQIKAIKIIMEKFQRRSQRSSRYTVHTTTETIRVTNHATSFGEKKCSENQLWSCWNDSWSVEPTNL